MEEEVVGEGKEEKGIEIRREIGRGGGRGGGRGNSGEGLVMLKREKKNEAGKGIWATRKRKDRWNSEREIKKRYGGGEIKGEKGRDAR